MKNLVKFSILVLLVSVWQSPLFGQCQSWVGLPNKDALEEAHVLYRQFMKTEEYDKAFEYWEKAYKGAPAADGQRSSHFVDGRKIYLHKFKKATDEAQKKEFAANALRLFDEQGQCYPNEKAVAQGLKAYEMFYTINSPYPDTKKACQEAIMTGGNNTSYAVFQPYASIIVWQYQNKQAEAAEAREVYTKLNEIADHNITNNAKQADAFKQAKEAMNGTFAAIENEIFDCNFFKSKLEPDYRAHPDDTEVIKFVYNKLKTQGCADEDLLVAELKGRYETIVAAENEKRLAQHYADNPGDHAIALFKENKFTEALQKFEAGIAKEKAGANDGNKLADYYFYMASIEFRQMNRYSAAREDARTAAKYRPGWGQPYMLIGDMYASTSNSCGGDAFDASLAVLAAIDKYAYAKSIDGDVAGEANSKINRYSQYYPAKEEAFMRKLNEGSSMTVPCWIGETVRLRLK